MKEKKVSQKQIVTSTTFVVSIHDLAHHLGRSAFPESVLAMLNDNPEEAEIALSRLVTHYLSVIRANISIASLKFTSVVSPDDSQSIAYFPATLVGTREELAKVVSLKDAEPVTYVTKQ